MTINIKKMNLFNNLENIIFCIICIMTFGLPLSTSLTTVTGILIGVLCIFMFRFNKFNNIIGISILLLFMWYCFRGLNSLGDIREIGQYIHKIARFLVIPILPGFFINRNRRYKIIITFIILTILSVLTAIYKGHVVFKDSIITSLFVAYSIFILLHLSYEHKNWCWVTIPFIILLTYYLIFIGIGRSGQVIFFILSILFCLQRFHNNLALLILSPLILLFIVISSMFVHSSFVERHKVAISEIQSYSVEHEEEVPDDSSMGVRFILFHNTWELIKKKPIIGWGTGSYKKAYAKFAPEAKFNKDILRANPHNQYLATWVETGILGLIILLGFLIILLINFWKQNNFEGHLGVGLLIAYIAGFFVNSWLFDHATAHFFILMVVLCLSTKKNTVKYI